MNRKWNLQDIRPAGSPAAPRERVRRMPVTVAPDSPRMDMVPPRETPQRPHQQQSFRTDPDLGSIDIIDGGSRRKKRIVVSIITAFVIIGAGFGASLLTGGADVTVYPKNRAMNVDATFSAYIAPPAGELGYELLTLEANNERQVSATGEETVSERATGNIFIYNAHSNTPQRLIKNTRFESKDGFIFKITESVEVPGYTEDAKGNRAPGVISATVFADGTGEQYNIGPGRFTIPGLKGSAQFDTMYGESTDSFSGGFDGKRYIIAESELETAKQMLHRDLRDALLARLETERPNGFVVYKDAVTFSFDSLPATEYGDKMATIKERARLQVPIFKETDFATYLAQNTIIGYEGEPVYIEDPLTLAFSYPSPTTTTSDISSLTDIPFTLKGGTRIIWIFDETKLKTDLLGLSKTAIDQVLTAYPAIKKAEAVVRPFWKQAFPDNPDEVVVTTIIQDLEDDSSSP